MGILKQALTAFLAENTYRKIEGDWLSFGRQTIGITKKKLQLLCESVSIDNLDLDEDTRHGGGLYVSDRALIESLFSVSYKTVDKSPYEKADLVMDLSSPVEHKWHSSFDFVYSGGCLDNVFAPSELIKNSSRLLRPGGRVCHYESASRLLGAFSYLTAEWFLSYYAVNNFTDCQVYLLTQTTPSRDRLDYDVDVFHYSHLFTRNAQIDYFAAAKALPGIQYLLVLAEKGTDSTCDLVPDQLQYLDEKSVDWRERAQLYRSSPRPLIKGPSSKVIDLPFLSDHYTYCGSDF